MSLWDRGKFGFKEGAATVDQVEQKCKGFGNVSIVIIVHTINIRKVITFY